MTRLTLAQTREPITATCARCGNEEAVILPDPAPRGTFYCGPCFEASMIRLIAEDVKAKHETHESPVAGCDWCIAATLTESELRALDGDR